jgi:hypothetical protein
MAATLRVFGAMLILAPLLVALLAPSLAAAFMGEPSGPHNVAGAGANEFERGSDYEGGACGEDEEFEELIDCGADLEAHLDEPFAIAVLRSTEVRTTKQQCEELLADIWERQSCSADNRECGKLIPAGMPGPGPKLAGSSISAHTMLASLGLADAQARRLGPPTDERMPKLRDLSPPVPPPRLDLH